MKTFEYGDNQIGSREVSMTISSIMIGVGILTMPNLLAKHVESSDGWISILAAGLLAAIFGLVISRLTSRFQGDTFHRFTARITAGPIAAIVSAIYGMYFFLYLCFEVRALARIAKLYLFENTPVAVISVAFLLVVVYAVSGTTTAIIRLNAMFLPIVLLISAFVFIFGIQLVSVDNLRPFLVSAPSSLAAGTKDASFSLLGFEVLLFYAPLLRSAVRTDKAMLIGIAIPVALYLLTYVYSIAIFTREGTAQIVYPTVEVAKEVRLPGQFFERLESVFFTVWIMTIFNTSSMAFEASVSCIKALFTKLEKRVCIWILCPVAYVVSMLPKDAAQFNKLGIFVSYLGYATAAVIPVALLLVSKLRGGARNG
ncbi:GerAB/ArcD/ProY family transporter [Cohnella sp. JJ-181]|uniref:GerAB/ArcD/ProY family transporter n=1 Tax=Cohnella rhizoplanae TaxID=2974897 RepID=UPI0022FF76C4|nr:endospore germination permease [Cohnella sp. JJ-181]CAI6047735.1 Spore germination protein YndE [Cohnella sp. JJ-181]